jgi:PleD family two-component response regulator
MSNVSILIIDDDKVSQLALQQILDSEGWRVHVVPLASQGLLELAKGEWTLVVANITLTDTQGPHFEILRELAQADAGPVGTARRPARVLFLVPELAAKFAQPVLERARLPYILKPIHLHDFLEKMSDLLLEAGAIAEPIVHMRSEISRKERLKTERLAAQSSQRQTRMFASREDYQMSEEEITEYEKQEEAESKQKKEKAKQSR